MQIMLLYTKHNGTIEHAFDARQGVACRLHTRNTLCPRHTRVLQMLWGPTVDKLNNGGHTLLVPARCIISKSQHDAHQSSSVRVFINTTIRTRMKVSVGTKARREMKVNVQRELGHVM